MSEINKINEDILNLWDRNKRKKGAQLTPLFFNEIKTGGILFIGMNPSFNPDKLKGTLKGSEFEELDLADTFSTSNLNKLKIKKSIIEKSISIDSIIKGKYPYFSKFDEISEASGLSWEHIDLFFIRETKQNIVKKFIFEKGEKLNCFGKHQLMISKEAVNLAKPKIIVVANALASRIFRDYYSAEYDEENGYHVVTLDDNRKVPVFMGSMLTGQRAMDIFSFQRLQWHIKKTLENLN